MSLNRIAFIGFGEVGQTLAEDLKHLSSAAFDLKFGDPSSKPSLAAKNLAVDACANARDAAAGAQLVISAVTAAQTENAAASVVDGLEKGAWYFDVNSASPSAKIAAAAIINDAGGRYVEASIMSPIHPKRINAPMLLGGPYAKDFAKLSRAIGFAGVNVFSEKFGQAAAAKLCRSVMIKGLESLLTESLLTARRFGVEQEVLKSLENLLPHPDWPAHARYMISRTLAHGARRAEEMREATKMIRHAGLSPLMSSACAERQDFAAAFDFLAEEPDFFVMIDGMLAGASEEPPL